VFPLLGEVAYCPARDERDDLRLVDVGAKAASDRAARRPGQQAGALPRRVQAWVIIGSSKVRRGIARRYGVLLAANGTTVALACEDRIRENP
jgi:hypothetical protein